MVRERPQAGPSGYRRDGDGRLGHAPNGVGARSRWCPTCICVLRCDQMVAIVPDGLEHLRAAAGRPVTLVSGPWLLLTSNSSGSRACTGSEDWWFSRATERGGCLWRRSVELDEKRPDPLQRLGQIDARVRVGEA